VGRDSKRRKRQRKARRQASQAADAEARKAGLPLPSLFPNGVQKETRDIRLRWQGLSARGGLKMSFTGSGKRIPVDFDDPAAEHALALSLVSEDHGVN
jgi:hypothetical protein